MMKRIDSLVAAIWLAATCCCSWADTSTSMSRSAGTIKERNLFLQAYFVDAKSAGRTLRVSDNIFSHKDAISQFNPDFLDPPPRIPPTASPPSPDATKGSRNNGKIAAIGIGTICSVLAFALVAGAFVGNRLKGGVGVGENQYNVSELGRDKEYRTLSQDVNPKWFKFSPVRSSILEAHNFDRPFFEWNILREESLSSNLKGRSLLKVLTTKTASKDESMNIVKMLPELGGVLFWNIRQQIDSPHGGRFDYMNLILSAAKEQRTIHPGFLVCMVEKISNPDLRPEQVLSLGNFAVAHNIPLQVIYNEHILDLTQLGMGAFKMFEEPLITISLRPELASTFTPDTVRKCVQEAQTEIKRILKLPRKSRMCTKTLARDASSSVGTSTSSVHELKTKMNAVETSLHESSFGTATFDLRSRQSIMEFLETIPRHGSRDHPYLAYIYQFLVRYLQEKSDPDEHALTDQAMESPLPSTFPSLSGDKQRKESFAIRIGAMRPQFQSVSHSRGQKYIGSKFDPEEYQKFIAVMETLRMNGLLEDIGKEQLIETNTGNENENEEKLTTSTKFKKILADIEEAARRNEHPVWISIQEEYGPRFMNNLFQVCLQGLRTKRVRVWEVIRTDTLSGHLFDSCFHVENREVDVASSRSEAHSTPFSIREEETLHIYVNRSMPNPAEAILYSYARAFSSLSHTECVLLESLLLPKHSEFNDDSFLLSKRIKRWLNVAPHMELARLIVNGRLEFNVEDQGVTSRGGSSSALELPSLCAQQVSVLCQQRLEKQDEEVKHLQALDEACIEDSSWAKLFDDSAWSQSSLDALLFVLSAGMRPRYTLLRHMHQRIMDEIIASIRRANPYSIRHPDLITVYNETLGRTEEDMKRIFGLSRHQVSRVLYTQLRENYCEEDPEYSSFLPENGPYVRKEERLLSNDLYKRKYFDGLYFLPFSAACIRYQVGLALPEEHMNAFISAILLALPSGGAMIAVLIDAGSFFKWEYCFAHHFVLQLKSLVGFVTVIPLCVSGLVISLSGKNFFIAIIFSAFYFLFNMMFLLVGAVFSNHSKSIWRSNEGKVGIFALILNIMWSLPLYVFPEIVPYQWRWVIEATGLMLSCFVLWFGYLFLSNKKSAFFRDLTFTSTDDLMKAIERTKELPSDDSVVKNISKDKVRKKFIGAVHSHSFPKGLNPEFRKLVQQRRSQRHREDLLMEWYSKLYKQAPPPPRSEEWDSTLQEAQNQMILTSKTDILSRVGAFNKNTGKQALMGAIYYIALMLDFSIHHTCFNAIKAPFGSDIVWYWGNIYVILAFAGLEGVPSRVSALERAQEYRINVKNVSVYEEFMTASNKRRRNSYNSNLRRMFRVVLPVAITVSGVGAACTLRGKVSFELGVTWISRIVSYTGLPLSYYNLLFLTRPMNLRMILCFGSGIPLGASAAIFTVAATGNSSFEVLALGICAWVMFFFSHRFVSKQSKEETYIFETLKNDVSLFGTQRILTCGQSWIGAKTAPFSNATSARSPLIDAIRAIEHQQQEGKTSLIMYECTVGETIVGLMRQSARTWSSSGSDELPSTAYIIAASEMSPTNILYDIIRDWKDGKIIVEQYEEEATLFDPSSFSCFSGVGKRTEDGILHVFVGVGDIHDISEHAIRVAETIIHEYVEIILGKQHNAAVLSELLVHGGQIVMPSRIMHQIELMDRDMLERILEGTVMALIRASTQDVADALFDNWSTLKALDREAVIRRLKGVFNDTDEVIYEGHCILCMLIHNACWERVKQLQDNGLPQNTRKRFRLNRQDSSQSAVILRGASESADRIMFAMQSFFYICLLQIVGDHSVDHEIFHASTKTNKVRDGGLPNVLCWILRTFGLPIHRFVKRLASFITWRTQLSRKDVQELYDAIESINGTRKRLVRREFLPRDTIDKGCAFEEHWDENGKIQKVIMTNDRRTLYWVDADLDADIMDELGAEETMAVRAKLTFKFEDVIENKDEAVAEFYEDLRADPKTKVRFVHLPEEKSRYPVQEEYYQTIGQAEKLLMTVTLDRHGWPTHGTLNMARGKKTPFELIWPSMDAVTGVHPTYAIVYLEKDLLEIQWFLNGDNEWALKYVAWQGVRSTRLNRNGKTGDWVSFGISSSGNRSISCDTPEFVRTDVLDIILLLELVQAHHIRNPLVPILPKAPDGRCFSCMWPLQKKTITLKSSHSAREFYALGVRHTKAARTALWKAWRAGRIEGFVAQVWDELLLRKEPSLQKYWKLRDVGRYVDAAAYLELHYESIHATCMINASDKDIMTLFCYRMSDLSIMGIGGQSPNLNHHQEEESFPTTTGEEYKLRVAGIDSGTWPFDGGGVASCRRDLVDRLPRLSWTMYPEVGDTRKEIKYRFEENVMSITPIFMWGCDNDGPNQRILSKYPYIKIIGRRRRTTDAVLRNLWVPLLQELVRLLAKGHSYFPLSDELDHSSRFVSKLHVFFEEYDWISTWSSQITMITWNHAWMLELENSKTAYFRSELPTILDLGATLSMVMHFLTFLSVPLEALPVFHGTHHGPQLLLGVIAKERFGSSLVIWDHGLLWRERLKGISELSEQTLFTKNVLVKLTTFSARVIYHKADAIVSCASIGNPEWQQVIGGGLNEGSRSWESIRTKLSPVVNGMETDRFFPCRSSEEPYPCAVMVS